jgi:hypothetical protein
MMLSTNKQEKKLAANDIKFMACNLDFLINSYNQFFKILKRLEVDINHA